MGRFYKTATPTFVDDNIFLPPWQLAAQVVTNIDKEIDDKIANLDAFNKMLQAQGLKPDKPRLQEIITGYEKQIEELAGNIQKNPLEYRRDSSSIRRLGKDIHENWTRGEVAAIQGNKATYDNWKKNHLEKVKATKGYVTQEDVTYAEEKFLKDFSAKGGTMYKSPSEYQAFESEDLNPYVDIENLAETRGENYVADVVESLGAYSDGKYIYKSKDRKEIVTYNEILQGVQSAIANDTELMNYYKQKIRLGAMTPEQAQGAIDAAANRVANKYSYQDISQGRTALTADPYGLEEVKQANKKDFEKFKKEIENPEISFTERTENTLDPSEFKKKVDIPIVNYQKDLQDKLAKVKDLSDKLGNNHPQVQEALREVKAARLNYLNMQQAKDEREQDFKAEISNSKGMSDRMKQILQDYSFDELSKLNINKFLKDQTGHDYSKPLNPGETRPNVHPYLQNRIEEEIKTLQQKQANFNDSWAKTYADSHKKTSWFINTTVEPEKNYYNKLGMQMLKSGQLEFLDPKGNLIKGFEIETGFADTPLIGADGLKTLMATMGTNKIEDVLNVNALYMNSGEMATMRVNFTPEALSHMDIGTSKEFTVRATGTNLSEVGYEYAKEHQHTTSRGVKSIHNAEDAFRSMQDPVFNHFVNKLQDIPLQPATLKDPDKSYSQYISTGSQRVKVTRLEGIGESDEPIYELQNEDGDKMQYDMRGAAKTLLEFAEMDK